VLQYVCVCEGALEYVNVCERVRLSVYVCECARALECVCVCVSAHTRMPRARMHRTHACVCRGSCYLRHTHARVCRGSTSEEKNGWYLVCKFSFIQALRGLLRRLQKTKLNISKLCSSRPFEDLITAVEDFITFYFSPRKKKKVTPGSRRKKKKKRSHLRNPPCRPTQHNRSAQQCTYKLT
jgi:hypothetical protein